MNTIVLGSNHNNTLGLIWSLGEAGHKIVLLLYDSGNNYVDKSKYISETHLIHQGDNVIDLIKLVSSKMDSKPVVFVSNDGDATRLNEHFAELSPWCFFEGGRPDGSVNLYRDKDAGENLAKKCGFMIPATKVIGKPNEISSISWDYPIVIKANNSTHGGKSSMKKCNSEQEAKTFVQGLPSGYFPLQVQQFIEKEHELMLLGCSLYGGKEVICPIANKKIRQYPSPMGLGSYSESIAVRHQEDLELLASKVTLYLKEIEYTGNFSAEFLYSKGEYYFLEINLRNDGTSWLSTCSGFNLPDMVCRSFVEDNVSDEGCIFRKMNYMNTMADVQYWIDGTVSWRQWRKQFKSDTCYSHYNKNDNGPFKYYFRHPLISIAKLLVKKALRICKIY